MIDWGRCAEIANEIRESSADISFLSEVIIDDEDLDYIIQNFIRIMVSDRPDAYILTAYVMVVAGKSFDGSYWPHLCELVNISEFDNKDRNDLKDIFHKGLLELGLSKDIATERNVEQYLAHTLVPDKEEYMDNFFSFIYSFYKDVLVPEYTDNTDSFELPEDFSEPLELLSAIVKEEVKGDQYPSIHALNKCTLYALEDPQNYHKIMIKILNIIHAGYKGRKVSGLGNNRFAIPFQRWYMFNIGRRSRNSLSRELEMRRARIVLSLGDVRIEIPAMKCTQNATLIVKSGRKVVKEITVRTFSFKIQGKTIHKMANDYTLDPSDLGIDPFDKFNIELDGRSILSSVARDYFLFNENMVRTNSLNIGTNYIFVKDADVRPACETATIHSGDYNKLFFCDLEVGDKVTIGETQLTVMSPKNVSEGIDISASDGIFAVSNEGPLPICLNFNVRCFVSNVTPSSRIIVKITVDDDSPYHRILKVNKNNISNGFFVNKLSKDDNVSTGIHMIFMELYHNGNKIDESKFLTIPEYKYGFDHKKQVYIDETEGVLTITAPIRESIAFHTSDEYLDVQLPSLETKIRHIIPALRISTDCNVWRSPGDYDIKYADFHGDHLWVYSDCSSSLYCGKRPILKHRVGDYDVYDFHKIHELHASKIIHNVEVEVSLEKSPRFHLFNIWLCNEYGIKKFSDSFEISVTRHTSNKIVAKINETESEYEIIDDVCKIQKPECNFCTVVISEVDEYGLTNIVHSEEFYEKQIHIENETEKSCTLVCLSDTVSLTYKERRISEMMIDYDNKSRFNPWMKKNRSKVIDYFKSINIKE